MNIYKVAFNKIPELYVVADTTLQALEAADKKLGMSDEKITGIELFAENHQVVIANEKIHTQSIDLTGSTV